MISCPTSTYVALLSGIHVGGDKIIKMDELRKAFKGIGFADVATYVQSGNVAVPVIVRTAEEMGEVAKGNPFLKETGIDTSRLHVTFLSGIPQETAVNGLDTIAAGADRFCCIGQEIFLHCPNGLGATKLSINVFEKLLFDERPRATGIR